MSTMQPVRIRVDVPGAAHDVVVGAGVAGRLGAVVPVPPHARRAVVVTNPVVGARWGRAAREGLAAAGLEVDAVEVPDGEGAKSPTVLGRLWTRFAALPLGRDDLVVGLGGGVVTDLAGFAAATWHRGVAVAQVPTTLLGQVDAAVGGKTGINLPEGKNLVGAFHQPVAVVADTATLATLPARELRSGLGEVAKYGFIADPGVLDLLEGDPAAVVAGDPDLLTDVVVRGVRVKAALVAADEREGGDRALLNYGHTFGHAIEAVTGYGTYRHGEAVALGMVAAARLGEALGVTEAGLADRTVALLAPLGLPTGGLTADPDALWAAMARDKKARGGVRFVLCRRPGSAFLSDPVERAAVEAVLDTLR